MSLFQLLPVPVKVRTDEEADAVVAALKDKKWLAFDTETTGLSRTRDYAVIMSLSSGEDRYVIWPSCIPRFKKLLENPEVKLIAHNANFDQWMLLNVGIDLNRNCLRAHYRVYDTMVMHALFMDDAPHDLKSISRDFLGVEMASFKDTFVEQLRAVKKQKKQTMSAVFLDPKNEDLVANYASLDAYSTFKLFFMLKDLLETKAIVSDNSPYRTMWEYFLETEVPFTKVLWCLEREGIKVDTKVLLELAPILEAEILEIQKWFGRETGNVFINLESGPQMAKFFFEYLGRTPLTFTEKGNKPQLNAATLKAWASAEPKCVYAEKLLRYREQNKKLGTYIVGLLETIHRDGRIHTTFNQATARTGRLSSEDPNLQNQPTFIREAYIVDEGNLLFAADYSQLEMRVIAHFSKDETLCNSIKQGLDVHSATAAKMFGVPYEDIVAAVAKNDRIGEDKKNKKPVTEVMEPHEQTLVKYRKAAKTINFMLLYGGGAGKLSDTLKIPIEEAKELIKQYFDSFPRIIEYFDSTIEQAVKDGFCTTALGRRRQVLGLRSLLRIDRSAAERKVKNSPIQGTAADITKLAMIQIYEDPYITASGARMLLQIHDEIVMEVPEHLKEDYEFNSRVQRIMAHPFTFELEVPLQTSAKYGKNWKETK